MNVLNYFGLLNKEANTLHTAFSKLSALVGTHSGRLELIVETYSS